MKLKIYTRTGDKGMTSLYGGSRVDKFDPRVEAYGTVDELNSAIGVVISYIDKKEADLLFFLTQIQSDLLSIGAYLAGSKQNLEKLKTRVTKLEKTIDKLDQTLPELKNFILPAGTSASSFSHLARSICRRAERGVVKLSYDEQVNPKVIMYLNRLSDFLFVLARYLNLKGEGKETVWMKT